MRGRSWWHWDQQNDSLTMRNELTTVNVPTAHAALNMGGMFECDSDTTSAKATSEETKRKRQLAALTRSRLLCLRSGAMTDAFDRRKPKRRHARKSRMASGSTESILFDENVRRSVTVSE